MKAKVLIVIFVSSLIIISGVSQTSAQLQSAEHLKEYYEICIEKKIAKCQSKTILKTSRSNNLQQAAETAAEQISFLTLNKATLVNEMIELNIGQKSYKIEYYLNSRFYEVSN